MKDEGWQNGSSFILHPSSSIPHPSPRSRMRIVQAIGDDLDELVEIERLEDGVADGVRRDLLYAPFPGRGEDDDVGAVLGVLVGDALDELVSVEAGHHEVEEDQVERAVVLHLLQPHRPILGQLDLEFHPPQHGLEEDTDREVIIDDEDLSSRAVDFSYRHLVRFKLQYAKYIPA